MCRYAMTTYKPHYACFGCRKSFKRRLLIDVNKNLAYAKEDQNMPSKCPQCGELMANMGLDFKAPKMKEIKTWAHLKNLYEGGITWHSCGCSGPGYIPKDKNDLIRFLEQTKEDYINNRRCWVNQKNPKSEEEREDAINYWMKKITDLELRLTKLQA